MKNEKFTLMNEQFITCFGEELTKYFGEDEIVRFIITDKIKKMLLETRTPKKTKLFKLPFEKIFLDVFLENDKIEIPHGIFVAIDDDLAEDDVEDEKGFLPMRIYHLVFDYRFKGFKEIETIHLSFYECIEPIKNAVYLEKLYSRKNWERYKKTGENSSFYTVCKEDIPRKIFNDAVNYYLKKPDKWNKKEAESFLEETWNYSDHPRNNYKYWNLLNQKHIISFICNFLLFLNDPRVSYIKHAGESKLKNFKKGIYEFKYPKTATIYLNGELQKYIDNYKPIPTGVRFVYSYKFLVRGHFRRLINKKYREKKIIWITPFYKGQGGLVQKEYKLEKEA